MGLFDDLNVPCPACGASEQGKGLVYQTKGGDWPQLESIALASATPQEIADIHGDTQACRSCGARFTACVELTVKLTLDPDTDAPGAGRAG